MIEIKHRHSGVVLFSGEFATVKEAVESATVLRYADLGYADLRYADLRYADLGYADLQSADLSYANLSCANLQSADLRYANLRYADLSYANLSCANLRYADLGYADLPSGFRIASLCFGGWPVTVTPERTTIGCQQHENDKWLKWTPDDVAHMHLQAQSWWADHGEVIKAVICNVMQKETK